MPSKLALVNYNKCRPEEFDKGICTAALAYPRKLLKQEVPYVIPMPDPSVCQGCGDCARACQRKAIQITRM